MTMMTAMMLVLDLTEMEYSNKNNNQMDRSAPFLPAGAPAEQADGFFGLFSIQELLCGSSLPMSVHRRSVSDTQTRPSMAADDATYTYHRPWSSAPAELVSFATIKTSFESKPEKQQQAVTVSFENSYLITKTLSCYDSDNNTNFTSSWYHAIHRLSGVKRLIKMVPIHHDDDEENNANREMNIVHKLQTAAPGSSFRLLEVYQESSCVYFVMELQEGQTLVEHLQQKQQECAVKNIFQSLLKSLAKMHSLNICLTPTGIHANNVFVANNGTVAKFVDFESAMSHANDSMKQGDMRAFGKLVQHTLRIMSSSNAKKSTTGSKQFIRSLLLTHPLSAEEAWQHPWLASPDKNNEDRPNRHRRRLSFFVLRGGWKSRQIQQPSSENGTAKTRTDKPTTSPSSITTLLTVVTEEDDCDQEAMMIAA